MKLQGKIVAITGGTSGIGLATVEIVVSRGATVIALGRKGPKLDAVKAAVGPDGMALECDVADPQSISNAMSVIDDHYGRIDALVLAAGVSNAPEISELNVTQYADLMDVNCRGVVFSFVHALPILADKASVVIVGSVSGRRGQPGDPLYAGSKGFVRAFARSAGTNPDILAKGIRVNVVSPGPIETPLTQAVVDNPESDTYVRNMVPMHRWGQAIEVAEAILFLASSASSFTTGADITVDGGMSHV